MKARELLFDGLVAATSYLEKPVESRDIPIQMRYGLDLSCQKFALRRKPTSRPSSPSPLGFCFALIVSSSKIQS